MRQDSQPAWDFSNIAAYLENPEALSLKKRESDSNGADLITIHNKVRHSHFGCRFRPIWNQSRDDAPTHGDLNLLPIFQPSQKASEILPQLPDACRFVKRNASQIKINQTEPRKVNEPNRYKIFSFNSERDKDVTLGLAQSVFVLASSL